MATFTQLYVQTVFAVKNRQSLILAENKDKIEKYICGIASNIKCTPNKKKSFKDEYIAMLKAFEIDYDETYLFDWID